MARPHQESKQRKPEAIDLNNKKKKEKIGIKFPNGEIKEIIFSSPSSSGFVFGLTHSSNHVTVIEGKNGISSHTTEQGTKKHTPLGKLSRKEMTSELWLKILKPRKLNDFELGQTMMYFTKKWGLFLNIPDKVCFKLTKDKSMRYLDLNAIFKRAYSFMQGLKRSPEKYFGICPIRQMSASKSIEYGLLENEKLVVRIGKDLCVMDLSLIQEALFMQGNSVSDNPMLNILKTMGVTFLQEGLMKRVRELALQNEDTPKVIRGEKQI